MIIFTDILTGDELLSDAYPMTEILDGFFYEVEGKWVTKSTDVNVDIGANPSAEEEEEGTDSTTVKVVDLIDAFKLTELFNVDKKEFGRLAKQWSGNISKALEGKPELDEFKAKAGEGMKFILSKVKDMQFFYGESYANSGDDNGTLVYAYYKEGKESPTFLYPKLALKEVKC